MTDDSDDRVTTLTQRVDGLDVRVDANTQRSTKAVREAHAATQAHRRTITLISALRETQIEHGRRLDRIDGRLDRIDGRLDRIDGRLDRIDERLDTMNGRVDGLAVRMDQIGGSLGQMAAAMHDMQLLLGRLADEST